MDDSMPERPRSSTNTARPITVPREPAQKRKPLRQTMSAVLAVGTVGLVVVVATTMLGKNNSSKFSNVGSAICDTRRDGPHHTLRLGVIASPILDVGAMPAHESACGGASNVAPSTARPAAASTVVPSLASGGAAGGQAADAAKAAEVAAVAGAPEQVPGAVPDMGPAAAGHSFISTATMTVRVDDANVLNQKKTEAIELVEGSGGGLFGEQTSFNGEAHATITLKVPPSTFRPLLSQLAALGTLQEQEVKTDDVTQQVIDLDARIISAQEGLDRMRGLLTKAADLNQVATLEADVARRQTEVEQLRGQQLALGQRIDLATIVLTLTTSASKGPAGAPTAASTATTIPTTTTTKAPRPLPGFSDGLENGWSVFTTVGSVALACFGAALPFLPFAVAALVVWQVAKRRRARLGRAGSATTATSTATA